MVKRKRYLGPVFSDEVAKLTSKKSHIKRVETQSWVDILIPNFDLGLESRNKKSNWTTTLFLIFYISLFFILFLRLFHLQIAEGEKNRELADGNRIQVKVIHAQRGAIFDRNGKILAANSPAFRLFDKQTDTSKAKLISREEALELEVKNDPRVLDLEIDNVRIYPLGEKLAHVLGYVGEVSSDQLKKEEFKNYKLGDKVGQSGVEAQYEKILRGKDGGEIIEVDSKGAKVRTIRRNQPIPGQNIYLTIDLDLQEKIYFLMKDTLSKVGSLSGAALAIQPQTGQILALISFPTFDPNLFANPSDDKLISEILTRSDAPILNRAIAGTYPPGSTFKIVSALAALASDRISQDTIFQDNGVVQIGSYKFYNWYFTQYGKTEGGVNLIHALERSTDTYFYQVGQTIGEQSLIDWAKKLRLGGKLEIDLPEETEGLVPDGEWKKRTFGEVWYPGDTLHMSIGQGFVLTTPLQILGITAFIAAGGSLFKPQLLLKAVNDKLVTLEFKPKDLVSNLVSKDKIKVIQDGLKLVPKQGGTAWPFFTFPIETAGKTGTAEYGDANGRTHAWYTSYAPATDPKIALTILIEGGGEGSSVSAPVAKEAYRWYFSEDKNKLIQDIYTQATDSGRTLGE